MTTITFAKLSGTKEEIAVARKARKEVMDRAVALLEGRGEDRETIVSTLRKIAGLLTTRFWQLAVAFDDETFADAIARIQRNPNDALLGLMRKHDPVEIEAYAPIILN